MPRAGLDAATVTAAGAALADEIGLTRLSMGLLAERLGVKTPSLYKHVASLADLNHRIAVLSALELEAALGAATEGRTGTDALAAAAGTMRDYVRRHPGRYAATVGARPTGPADPLRPALEGALEHLATVLRGYPLDPEQHIHALRMLRSALHGYATLEIGDGFQMGTDVDESFAWLVAFVDRGLRSSVPRPV